MITVLLEQIIQLLKGWINKFNDHAEAVEDSLTDLNNTASDIELNTDPIPDIRDNTGVIITPITQIKTNTDSIKTDVTQIKTDTGIIKNNANSIATSAGTAASFAEDCATNTLDIKDKITTIASDTTQLRTDSGNIAADVSSINQALGYYLANTPVTEDVEGDICNFDTDLEDYLQKAICTIPADASGISSFNVTKCGKNLFDPAKYTNLRTNYDYVENSYYCKIIRLNPNTTYTISQNAGTTDTAVILINKTSQVNSSGFFDLRKISDVKTYTTDNTGNLYIGIVSTGTDAQANARIPACNIQIEELDTATDYEAYKEMTYPIFFGSTITDGAEIDLLSGLMKVNTTPPTYSQLSPIAIRTYKGVNNIYADVGSMSLTYRETLKHYLDKQQ